MMSQDQTNESSERIPVSISSPGSESSAPGGESEINQTIERATELVTEALNDLAKAARQQGEELTERTEDLRDRASEVADTGIERTAEGLDTLAETLRDRAQQGDARLSSQVTAAANWLSQASEYLRGHDTEDLMTDFERFVRHQPVESVAGAIALGYLLGRIRR